MPRIMIAILLSALCFPGFADDRIIAIEGQGKIKVAPDIIRIEMMIEKQDKKDIAKAKSYVDEMSSNAAVALIANGVREQDIFSSSMSIRTAERYDDNDNVVPAGHVASRDIRIIVRDVNSYSAVIQALVDVGISEITSVGSDVSDYEALQKKALAKAAQAARENAGFLVNELGATLGSVHQIGKQRTYWNFTELEEVIVTGRERTDGPVKTIQYEFQPAPVEVDASVYVEFKIE